MKKILLLLLTVPMIGFGQEIKTAVIQATNMNILYVGLDNPISVAVSGYQSSDVTVSMSNGSITAVNKDRGEYIVRPSKKGIATITLYAEVDGAQTKMLIMQYRVHLVPSPTAYLYVGEGNSVRASGNIFAQEWQDWYENYMMQVEYGAEADMIVDQPAVRCGLGDFLFDGIKFETTGFTLILNSKGKQLTSTTKGSYFTYEMLEHINEIWIASNECSIAITDIKAKRTDGIGGTVLLNDIVFKIVPNPSW